LLRAVVTTARKSTQAAAAEAHAVAAELALPVVKRRDASIPALREAEGAEGVIVVAHDRITYHHPSGEFFFHPSMAKMRIKLLRLGNDDVAVRAMGLTAGMSVLDCTLGRAADACVTSFAVGPEGRVLGLEIDPIIAALTRRGLLSFEPAGAALAEAMRRVEVVHADHAAYLADLPDDCFDVVYFDPFFGATLSGSQAMDSLRAVGHLGPVSEQALCEAARVARRRVVYKLKRPDCPASLDSWRVAGGRKSRIEYRVLDLAGEAD